LGKGFSSSGEIFDWLSSFINFEKGHSISKSYRLDRSQVLARLAGNPERCAPAIHVAGSKGKGSVVAMAASVLEAAGMRVARYMSPHVSDFRERVSLGNSFFAEDVYLAAACELRELVEEKLPEGGGHLFDPATEEGELPTYFELLTLFYFMCARTAACDVLVVETGMGGRLDATNILDPLVSVITLIELEHTEWLGDTIAAIAGEKAGIIKPSRPVILSRQTDEALAVFRARASERESPLHYFPDIASVKDIRLHRGGTDFSLLLGGKSPAGAARAMELSIPIPGEVQAENAGLAVAAIRTAFPDIGDEAVRRGLESVKINARFEKVASDPPFIIDGAHTPESVALCADTFCSLYGEGGVLLFSCAADKNVAEMARVLLPRFSQIVITRPGSVRPGSAEGIFRAFGAEESGKAILVPDTAEAVRRALTLGRERGLAVLCVGSFYLAADARGAFV